MSARLLTLGLSVACLTGAACTPGPIDVATLPSGGLANGMIAHWSFDEGTGLVANDGSGNGRTAFVAGPSFTWIPGEFDKALHFSGADEVSVGGLPAATPNYTVSAWVLIQPYELGAPIANLLSTEEPGGGWALYATLVGAQPTYAFRYAVNAAQGYEVVSCACLVPGTWTHLAAVVDDVAGTLTLYVNDVATTVPATSAILPGSTTLYMARSALLSPTFPLMGALDDVVIYARALVAQEIAALTAASAPNPP